MTISLRPAHNSAFQTGALSERGFMALNNLVAVFCNCGDPGSHLSWGGCIDLEVSAR
jgi:hypothetical protein